MPKTQRLPVKDLSLDLRNFRIVPQTTEKAAASAIIAINKERFLGLMESLLEEEGFLPNETLIVIRKGKKIVVKEGNRRVAALKMIFGIIKRDPDHIPEKIEKLIAKLTGTWTKENEKVPCLIYEESDDAKVDRLVSLAHGKGEKASRDPWEAIARARHNRDVNQGNEAGLDLMESWLKQGKNINGTQRERFGGTYPLTVLNEALQRISPRYKKTPRELADAYPKLSPRDGIEAVLLDIGLNTITFESMRSLNALDNYGLPTLPQANTGASTGTAGNAGATGAGAANGGANTGAAGNGNGAGQAGPEGTGQAGAGTGGKPAAAPLNSQASVMRTLGKLKILGPNRDKVATLRDEARRLKLEKNPLAFCFVLRSMFEISAKAYCKDHETSGGPKLIKDGREQSLVNLLRDIADHIKKAHPTKEVEKQLHGAMTQLGEGHRLLSVTSMNQLVHNPDFTTDMNSICTVFHSIAPFLQLMNG
jgi:Txe/YoeB family toxin of Txe-Axe toxin-antitoxin module